MKLPTQTTSESSRLSQRPMVQPAGALTRTRSSPCKPPRFRNLPPGQIWSDERAVLANGPPIKADIIPVGGGYRLTGSWRFSSGCHHANWMVALVPKNRIGARMRSRSPDDLLLVMPKERVKLIDVWDVNGLRGTGSFNFEIDDLFVPESYTFFWSQKTLG